VRGLLQYYGASTGRFAGRLVQIHNLPRNNMSDLDLARRLLSAGHYEALEILFESVPDVLSQLIRTAFIPSPAIVL
jgi:DNA polymerase